MSRSFTARRALLSPSWSHPRSPSLQQRRLEQTNVNWEKTLSMAQGLVAHVMNTEKNSSQENDIQLPSTLPLSPLMDPNLISARKRHRTPKKRRKGPPSPYEAELINNPYAQALATPVRHCCLTGARLPSYFLINFGVVQHPTTGKPWHVPRAAVKIKTQKPAPEFEASAPEPFHESPPNTSRFQPVTGCYYLASDSAIKILSRFNRKLRGRCISARWKKDFPSEVDHLVWREDMDSFILELLRNHAVQTLRNCCADFHYHNNFQKELRRRQKFEISGVLWLGNPTPTAHSDSKNPVPEDDGDPRKTPPDIDFLPTPERPEPPPYAMVKCGTRNVPIYNLPALLGTDHMRRVRDLRPEYTSGSVLVKQIKPTMQLLQALWKLVGYLRPIN